jgi:hypothetical protein
VRGYVDIVRSTTACIHFVEAHEVDRDQEEIRELRVELYAARIRYVYVDCRTLIVDSERTCDAVSLAMGGEHVPYGEKGSWVELLDDMISLSVELPGLVIVIDHADQIFNVDRSQIFSLTESFLIQFHHWLKKSKPCHLCFQMSPHPLVEEVFGRWKPS